MPTTNPLSFSAFAELAELFAHSASVDADFAPCEAAAQQSRERAERERVIARHARLLDAVLKFSRPDEPLSLIGDAYQRGYATAKAEVLRLLREEGK